MSHKTSIFFSIPTTHIKFNDLRVLLYLRVISQKKVEIMLLTS